MRRIDSHQHFWEYDPSRHAWIGDDMKSIRRNFLPEDLEPVLKQNNIQGCVAVQADQTEAETDLLLTLAGQHDFIEGVVGWVDLRSRALEERLQHYRQFPKLKGFRHIVQSEPKGFLADNRFKEGVRMLARYGFTYDLLVYHHQLPEALAFVHGLDDVKIVVDHLAKPSIRTGEKTHWELNMAALATFRNVFCKLSGMVTEANPETWKAEDIAPFLDEVFESFGADRLMYGSDWPVCLVAGTYEDQLSVIEKYSSTLSPAEKASVWGGNAIRFYNL